MCVFRACDLGDSASCIWDEDAQVWWSSEYIGRRDAVILCRRDNHAEVDMIYAS